MAPPASPGLTQALHRSLACVSRIPTFVDVGNRRLRVGAAGERYALLHLEARGLQILDRNFRTRVGELDLVAADEHTIVFCEVRTLVFPATVERALESIDRRKLQHLRAAAARWLAGRRGECGLAGRKDLRFDAVAVIVDADFRLRELRHLEGVL